MLRPLQFYVRGANILCQLTSGIKNRYVHTGRRPRSFLWLSDHTKDALRDKLNLKEKQSSLLETTSQFTPVNMSSSTPPPLFVDPPFTPVPGEFQALQNLSSDDDNEHKVLLYMCGTCKTPLFCSSEYTSSSALGKHGSGWPSFTAPTCTSLLRLRVVLQRTALQGGSNGSTLSVSLAARGLRREGEMVRRTRSGHCERLQNRTWREECLRDENKRSDPTVVEGCCAGCGRAVCRVVMERRGGVKYVVNPTAIVAEVAECNQAKTAQAHNTTHN